MNKSKKKKQGNKSNLKIKFYDLFNDLSALFCKNKKLKLLEFPINFTKLISY